MSLKEYSANELEDTLSAAFRLIGVFHYNIFDLSKVTVDSNNLEHAALLLRGLSSWSKHINGYEELINNTIKVCVDYNVDEQKLLFGLIPKDHIEFKTERAASLINNIINEFFGELITPSLIISIERKLNEVALRNKNIFCNGKQVFRFRVSSMATPIPTSTLLVEALDMNSKVLNQMYAG